MFNELQIVQLTHNIKEHNLKKGDKGTIVEIYKGGEAFEVEFLNKTGEMKAVLTLEPTDIQSIVKKNIYALPIPVGNFSFRDSNN